MADSRRTGISGITGKLVTIRHAREADRVNIREALGSGGESLDGLSGTEMVVAMEDDRMIGFGILKRDDGDGACLRLVENTRRRGIGRSILLHMLETAGPRKVVASREFARYLDGFGFRRQGSGPSCGAGAALSSSFCCAGTKGITVYTRTTATRD